jgi:hypothetical protein
MHATLARSARIRCRPMNHIVVALLLWGATIRSGLFFKKSPLQSSARPILENYGCRWNETWIKVLYEAGGPPDVIELLIQVSSRLYDTQQKLSKIP